MDNHGIDVQAHAEGLAFADYDRDGDLDLVLNVDGGANQLWENNENDAGDDRYLAVRALTCLGGGRYRDDIGAVVRLFAGDGLTPAGPAQQVDGGSGHGLQSPSTVHFGLPSGPAEEYVVKARFTNGVTVERSVVPAELGEYQLLAVKNCGGEDQPPKAFDLLLIVDGPATINLVAFDPEGNPLNFEIVDGPAVGTLTPTGPGPTFEYVPEAGFAGDVFTYRVSDGKLESNVARVVLKPAHPPFGEAAALVGLATPGGKKGGVAWCDFNEDGALDLLVNGDERSYLYFNENGTFADVTASHAEGLLQEALGLSTICGDLDNDGHVDFARNAPDRIEIYLNRGPDADPPWSFGKPPHQRPNQVIDKMLGGMNTEGMGWLDFDEDGDLDLVVDNHEYGINSSQTTTTGTSSKSRRISGRSVFRRRRRAATISRSATSTPTAGWISWIAKRASSTCGGTSAMRRSGPWRASTPKPPTATRAASLFATSISDGDLDVFWTDADTSQIWRNDDGRLPPPESRRHHRESTCPPRTSKGSPALTWTTTATSTSSSPRREGRVTSSSMRPPPAATARSPSSAGISRST